MRSAPSKNCTASRTRPASIGPDGRNPARIHQSSQQSPTAHRSTPYRRCRQQTHGRRLTNCNCGHLKPHRADVLADHRPAADVTPRLTAGPAVLVAGSFHRADRYRAGATACARLPCQPNHHAHIAERPGMSVHDTRMPPPPRTRSRPRLRRYLSSTIPRRRRRRATPSRPGAMLQRHHDMPAALSSGFQRT